MQRKSKPFIVFFFFLLIFFFQPNLSFGEQQRQVVLIICDNLQLTDIDNKEYPAIYDFFHNGASALLNIRTAGYSATRSHAAVTISSGRIAVGSSKEPLAFCGNEEYKGENVALLLQGRTGVVPEPDNLVVIDKPYLQNLQTMADVDATPGLLGSSLHEEGLKTACLGNADLPGENYRAISVIPMDSHGIIDSGDISSDLILNDPRGALGYRTNYTVLKKKFLEVRDEAAFVVIDLGDLERLERQRLYLTPEAHSQEKNLILKDCDNFLAWLLDNTDLQKSRVICGSVSPPAEAQQEGKRFAIIATKGEGIVGGLLTTPTTRRDGLTTLYDIAPNILDYLGANIPQEMVGRLWTVKPVKGSIETLKSIESRAAFTSNYRSPVIRGYVTLHLLALGTLIWFLWFEIKRKKPFYPLLLGLVCVPLSFLILAALPIGNIWSYLILLLLITALLVIAAKLFASNEELDPLFFICLVTFAVIIGDTLFGNPLQKHCILSYDAMIGARFYGIGNEYMGVLLGATLMGLTLCIQRFERSSIYFKLFLAAAFFLPVILVLATPQLGSNFGGTLATFVAFPYTFFRIFKITFRKRHLLIPLLIGVCAIGILLWDYSRPVELQSHFGQLIFAIKSSGWSALNDVLIRKLEMNLSLIRYTIWTKVFLGTLLALLLLIYKPLGIFRQVITSYAAVAAGIEGAFIAAFAALIFNDSGIVAAATACIFPAITLFFLVLREQESNACSTEKTCTPS